MWRYGTFFHFSIPIFENYQISNKHKLPLHNLPPPPPAMLLLCYLCGQPMSTAQRRKERRLRSCWRREQQSIAVAFAAATHHSAQQNGVLESQTTATRAREVEEHVTNDALRGQKEPPPGARPGILARHSAGVAQRPSPCSYWRGRVEKPSVALPSPWRMRQSCWRTRRRPSWRSFTLGRGLPPVMPPARSTSGTGIPGGSAGLSKTFLALLSAIEDEKEEEEKDSVALAGLRHHRCTSSLSLCKMAVCCSVSPGAYTKIWVSIFFGSLV